MADAFLPALAPFALPVDGPFAAACKSRGRSPASAAASTCAAGSAAASPESLHCESLDTPALGLELPFELDLGHLSTVGVIEVLQEALPPEAEDGAVAQIAPPPGLEAPARGQRAEHQRDLRSPRGLGAPPGRPHAAPPGLGAPPPGLEALPGGPLATVPLALPPPPPWAAFAPATAHAAVGHAAPRQLWSTQPQAELPWGPASAAPAATWAPPQASQPPAGAPALPSLPSVGSAGHLFGTCKPCAFFHTKGCGNGPGCVFCHLCEPAEIARRKKERKAEKQSFQSANGRPRAALRKR